jgi:hypothetical protein
VWFAEAKSKWCPHPDSNGDQRFRKPRLYPVEL